MRRLLTLAVAIAALVAFTSLARPDSAPSSRLRIGDADGTEGASEAETATAGAGRQPNANAIGGGLLRPLDIATLADVPANLLQLGPQEWTWPSLDGELLALPAFYDGGGGEVRVVDARTFSPVATVALGTSPVAGFLGFTLEADALLVQVREFSQPVLARHPLDPGRPVTRVELPQDVEFAGPMAVSLAGGRVAMVVVERGADGLGPRPARLVVADLLGQRLLVDLRLPEVRIDDHFARGHSPDTSLAYPAFAWDSERERLYVAHAKGPRITVVDLAAGAVLAEAEVGPDRAAGGEEPVQRWWWARVSPDGTRLYVAGLDSLPAAGTSEAPGLSVIDTATLAEVGHIAGVDAEVQLSPDGRWLLWASSSADGNAIPGRATTPRVALMATDQVGLVTLLGGRAGGSRPLGFSWDSSQLYLQREEEGRMVVVAHALPSLTRTGERLLARGTWFEALGGLLREQRGRLE